jgi:hypothetical protein
VSGRPPVDLLISILRFSWSSATCSCTSPLVHYGSRDHYQSLPFSQSSTQTRVGELAIIQANFLIPVGKILGPEVGTHVVRNIVLFQKSWHDCYLNVTSLPSHFILSQLPKQPQQPLFLQQIILQPLLQMLYPTPRAAHRERLLDRKRRFLDPTLRSNLLLLRIR